MHRSTTNLLCLASLLVLVDRPRYQRNPMTMRPKLVWNREVNLLLCEGEFQKCYHMTPESMERLVLIIAPVLRSRPHSWKFRGGISAVNKIQVTLRFLGGGAGHDIRRVSGMSRASFYRVLWEVVGAINAHERMRISFPKSSTDREAVVASFKALSTEGIFTGCIGCLDGWLCQIQSPRMQECDGTGPRPYYSGHYACFGINVQACCDAYCRITYLDLSNPGSCNDARAYRESALASTVDNFERGLYIIADNAYPCTQRMLTPFLKNQTTDRHKDAYNFFLSQLRIRIEMTFGLLNAKWQIFSRPLRVELARCPEIILCTAKLHNFVIEERLQGGKEFDPIGECVAFGLIERPGASVESILGFTPSEPWIEAGGAAHLRDAIVEKIKSLNLLRPSGL